MREIDYKWLSNNLHIFNNVRLSQQEKMMLILIYNNVTGQKQGMTGCARCISNYKKRVKKEYDSYESIS